MILSSETVLDDDYPVYFNYAYLADGRIILSQHDEFVADLKRRLGATEVRRCEVYHPDRINRCIGESVA